MGETCHCVHPRGPVRCGVILDQGSLFVISRSKSQKKALKPQRGGGGGFRNNLDFIEMDLLKLTNDQ